jgi:hypothetical protein
MKDFGKTLFVSNRLRWHDSERSCNRRKKHGTISEKISTGYSRCAPAIATRDECLAE